MEPLHLGNETISNKPWGICCFRLRRDYTFKKDFWGRRRCVDLDTFSWVHDHNIWYKTKKSQLQALEDLIKTYPNLKFIPVKNNGKYLPHHKFMHNIALVL